MFFLIMLMVILKYQKFKIKKKIQENEMVALVFVVIQIIV